MAWWIQPRLLTKDGRSTGRWRLTAFSDEDGGGPYPLCECLDAHATADEASLCVEARANAECYG